MYGMDTHTTVKTLLSNGISRRKIAEQLGIHRRVIKRIERGLASGSSRECYLREKKLAGFEQQVKDFLSSDLTAELIHQKLVKEHSLSVSYATVRRFVRQLKANPESFVPMHSAAGEEAQVDFGYLGVFERSDGTKVKVWVFCMVLSHSRRKPPTNPILVIRYSSPLHGMTNFMLGVSSMAAVILTVAKV